MDGYGQALKESLLRGVITRVWAWWRHRDRQHAEFAVLRIPLLVGAVEHAEAAVLRIPLLVRAVGRSAEGAEWGECIIGGDRDREGKGDCGRSLWSWGGER